MISGENPRARTWELRNTRGTRVTFLDLGGIITSIEVPDRHGRFANVALGYDTIDQYLADTAYLGALIGRYANRIANARFSLDGKEFSLPANEGSNHLHGGPAGFHRVRWRVTPSTGEGTQGAVLEHESPSGDQGYPGNLTVRISYTLTNDDDLRIEYEIVTTETTPVNVTQHSYFNLSGAPGTDILGHELTLFASRFTPVTSSLIPTGVLAPVAGTPFDFRQTHTIGDRIETNDVQLRVGDGYDHNFVLDESDSSGRAHAAQLRDPSSGRTLDVYTSEPGLQLYSGNRLASALPIAMGNRHIRRGGVALETQHFPDSPNHPQFPSTLLWPGSVHRSETIYHFSTDTR